MSTAGDLVHQAGAATLVGALHTRHHPFDTPTAATEAIQAWHQLLAAIDRHVENLLAATRGDLVDTSTTARNAALAMVAELGDVAGPHLAARPSPGPVGASWVRAAVCLGAASDQHLIDEPNPVQVAAALRRVAGLTEVALAVEPVLQARGWDAGLTTPTLHRWTPGLAANRAWAHTLATLPDEQLTTPTDGRGWVDQIESDPVVRLGDHLNQLRREATRLLVSPDNAVGSLRDLAAVGAAIHHHTALAAGTDPHSSTRPGGQRAKTWRMLRDDLAHYTSPGTPDPQLHADAMAIRQQLAWLVPEPHQAGWPAGRSRTLRTLASAVAVSADLAETTRVVFHNLADDGLLTRRDSVDPDVAIPATTDQLRRLADPAVRGLTSVPSAVQQRSAEPGHVLTRGALS